MEWLAWIAFGVIVVAGVAVAAWRAVLATGRGRRFLGLPLTGKLAFGRALLAGHGVPLVARGVVGILVVYLALPFDVIPDFVPVLGMLDDALIVMVAICLLLVLVPREVFERALEDAEAAERARAADMRG